MLWDPFLMKKLIKTGICGIHEQCTCALFTKDRVNSCSWKEKKKKKKKERKRRHNTLKYYPNEHLVRVWITSGVLSLAFFFFFWHAIQETNSYCLWIVATLFNFSTLFRISVSPCTVYGTYKSHFSVTFSLKMGFTVLFTHLKIILLQCFQFQQSKFYPNGPLFDWKYYEPVWYMCLNICF